MTTAQRIFRESRNVRAARAEAIELGVAVEAPNCTVRHYVFHDGSRLIFDGAGMLYRDGAAE